MQLLKGLNTSHKDMNLVRLKLFGEIEEFLFSSGCSSCIVIMPLESVLLGNAKTNI